MKTILLLLLMACSLSAAGIHQPKYWLRISKKQIVSYVEDENNKYFPQVCNNARYIMISELKLVDWDKEKEEAKIHGTKIKVKVPDGMEIKEDKKEAYEILVFYDDGKYYLVLKGVHKASNIHPLDDVSNSKRDVK